MSEIHRGLADLGRALAFLGSRPRLWKWLIAPALLALVVLVLVVGGVVLAVAPLIAGVVAWAPSWLEGIVSWTLHIAAAVGLGIVGLVVFTGVVGAIAGPFNELLSEAVEEELRGTPLGESVSVVAIVRDVLVGVIHAVRRLLRGLGWLAIVLAVGLVPVLGVLGAVALGGYLAASSAAYDSYDAVLSRRRLSYAAKHEYVARHRGRSLGLGLGVAGLVLVPVVNLFALGLGATAATLAIHELDGGGRPE
jgi:uncharacterized protein involved in cysteine biosynthesis